ncbi:MAG: VCBS repeat-containing protein [Thermoanaerobaculia bacterium]
MKRALLALTLLVLAACSTQTKPSAPPPAPTAGPGATPTPGVLMRTDPTVVEETDTYVIRRYKKSEYRRVDDRHFRIPIFAQPVEFFKEDDEYYYTSSPKPIPEEIELKRRIAEEAPRTPPSPAARPKAAGQPTSTDVTLADFADLLPARVAGRLRLEKVTNTGLPVHGMWRASFVLADANGDGIPDIVAPPSRIGDGQLHIWLGDGKGRFEAWPVTYTLAGKPMDRFSIDYGAVAVGDIDGDGKLDVVSASHGTGLVSLFGDGKGNFEVVRAGLPQRDYSSQAVILLDANGDGKLDIVASRDNASMANGESVDRTQVRVYVFLGRDKGWELKKDGIIGGFYSNSLNAWDYDRDGKKDVLTGSHYTGALTLLWRNVGDGTFTPVQFPEIEPYAYHFSATPGTFGKDHAAAFLDGYSMQANVPDSTRASGLTLYVYGAGGWTKHRVWRKKDFNGYLFAAAMGDLDGDGLDDLVFADNETKRLRVFFQQPDGTFVEAAEAEEPALDSQGQTVRLADLDRDGRLDIVLSKTVGSGSPNEPGGWDVYLNRR